MTLKSHTPCPDIVQSRRRFLQHGLGITTALALPITTLAKPHSIDRTLALHNLHTGEKVNATYWAEGEYQESELAAINRILRDHRTGDVIDIDPQLVNLLNLLHEQVGGRKAFNVISGYRSPFTNNKLRNSSSGVAKKSFHMQGRAIDIALPGCDLAKLNSAALAMQVGGVGYYPRSGFIHVDTGPVRNWG
ncbi:UNVERIFIED_CONTAM: hypothetical protein GTU68_009269 [Idotea baltica]|nr:hypothetical protein [Idotea baltica]